MKHNNHILCCLILIFVIGTNLASGAEKANPAECIKMCNHAADYLQNAYTVGKTQGDAALAKMRIKEENRFVWKNSYVFVICCECEPKTAVAHPIKPKLVGMDQSVLKDKKGKLFFLEFCKIAETTGEGWVEYFWPKVGEEEASRKVTFVKKVPDTDLIVGAGVYNNGLSSKSLEFLLKKYK